MSVSAFAQMDQGQGMMDQKQGMMSMDCSGMSADMQQFSSQLSPANMKMYCGKFNDDQRQAAMQMNGQMDASGSAMTPNGAVEKIAKDNNMMPAAATPGSRPGGACPVK